VCHFQSLKVRHFQSLLTARETEFGVPGTEWHDMGEHRTFKLSWLRKTYNKLGGLIHHRSPSYFANTELSSIVDPRQLRTELQAIFAEVERIASSQIDGSLAAVMELKCTICGAPIIRNVEGAKETQRADCLQTACGAQHHVEVADDGTVGMQLIATPFACMKCESPIFVENRKLKIGFEFTCSQCHVRHTIATRQWGYGMVDPGAPSA